MLYLIKIIFVFIVLGFTFLPSSFADNRTDHIDSLVEEITALYRKGNMRDAVNNSFKILELSEKENYIKGKVRGLICIAECLTMQAEYEKSMEYINKADSYASFLDNNPYDRWYSQKIQIDNYSFLGLDYLAERTYYEALQSLSREKAPLRRAIGFFNMYVSAPMVLKKNPDTVYYYLNKAREIIDGPDYKTEKPAYYQQNKAMLYVLLGDHHYAGLILDSAYYYYDAARQLLEDSDGNYYLPHAFDGLSQISYQQGDLAASIAYALLAIRNYEKNNMREDLKKMYLKISELYNKVGDQEKAQAYDRVYQVLKDSLETIKAKGRDRTILYLVNEKEEAIRSNRFHYLMFIGILLVISMIVISLTYAYYHKDKKKRDKLLQEKRQLIAAKEKALEELQTRMRSTSQEIRLKEEENKLLKQKARTMFEDLINLAKNNDPQFWTRFQEAYPDFTSNLLKVNPSLKISELTFCAYLYLGFSTKEMANFTFRALKTIENHRYNIRKRLGLSPEEDLSVWIQRQIKENVA